MSTARFTFDALSGRPETTSVHTAGVPSTNTPLESGMSEHSGCGDALSSGPANVRATPGTGETFTSRWYWYVDPPDRLPRALVTWRVQGPSPVSAYRSAESLVPGVASSLIATTVPLGEISRSTVSMGDPACAAYVRAETTCPAAPVKRKSSR